MAHRERSKLRATLTKRRAGTDQECLDLLLYEACKAGVDIEIRLGCEGFDLSPEGRSRRPQLCNYFDGLNVRIEQDGKALRSRQQLKQEPEPLWSKLIIHGA